MFLKAQDFNTNGCPLPQFYECDRIFPATGEEGQWDHLRLEGSGGAVTITIQPGWNYYILNETGRNVDVIQGKRLASA